MEEQGLTMSVEEAAKLMNVCRASAYAGAARGDFPTIKLGRRILVPRAAFMRWIEGAGEPEAPGGVLQDLETAIARLKGQTS